jgi:hypothetical protein
MTFGNETVDRERSSRTMTSTSVMKRMLSSVGAVTLGGALCAITGVGCVSVTNLEYKELVWELDETSEISISTHPAWFPRNKAHIPLVYAHLVTDDYVALEFHVREKGTTWGRNPHTESFLMRRLAYRLDGGTEDVVLTDYSRTYWSLDTGNYSERTEKGIPYRKGTVLRVNADLTFNGEDYSVEGEMPARRRVTCAPILLYYIGH